jgi:DNA-binding CsgD family transcriptional regulator
MPRIETLTKREREVAKAVSQGASNDGVANLLGIKEQTVKNHLQNIFEKFGCANRRQMVKMLEEK